MRIPSPAATPSPAPFRFGSGWYLRRLRRATRKFQRRLVVAYYRAREAARGGSEKDMHQAGLRAAHRLAQHLKRRA